MADGARIIGQHHWALGQYDSAAIYFNKALEAVDEMSRMPRYDETQVDDMYSVCYGALGNLNVDRDSIAIALHYYDLAGAIFEKHGWKESIVVIYHNESELYRRMGEKRKALACAKIAYDQAEECGDSLMIAMGHDAMADSYVALGRYKKALSHVKPALGYYNAHKMEEAINLSETLDTISGIYHRQTRIWTMIALAILALAIILMLGLGIQNRRRISDSESALIHAEAARADVEASRKQSDQRIEKLEKHIASLSSRNAKDNGIDLSTLDLSDTEQEIIRLLAKVMTSKQIADAIFLSPETIRW